MARPLIPDDFPLRAIGTNVYRRTESSPLFVAPDDALAVDLALRLNRDDASGYADPIPVFSTTLATSGIKGLAIKPDATGVFDGEKGLGER